MKTCGTLILIITLTVCLGTANANVTFTDFSDTTGLTLVGSAATVSTGDGTVLRLTPAAGYQSGNAFSSTTVNAATFSTHFKFRITSPGGASDGTNTGADGITFIVQSVSSSSGGVGGGIGYQGIGSSVAVEFDTWNNSFDTSSNHLGIDTVGNITSLATLDVSPRFDDENIWYAWVDYDGTSLEARANQTGVRPGSADLAYTLDVPTILGQSSAYIGFGSGTGAAVGNHDILSWEYRDQFNPVGGGGSTVPTPGAFLLAGMGAGLVGYMRRRRTL